MSPAIEAVEENAPLVPRIWPDFTLFLLFRLSVRQAVSSFFLNEMGANEVGGLKAPTIAPP
jgi:hypothetical protein